MYSVIAAAVNHPNAVVPQSATFNERICRSIAESETPLEVVSPRPFAPPFGPFSAYGDLPESEPWGPYTVHRPCFLYLLPKRLFYGLAGDSYARRVPAYVDEHLEVPDVVHACHVYLDGYGMLPYCREHDIPLFSVVHGTVVNGYEDLPGNVRQKVHETLESSAGVCCVSEALAAKVRHLLGGEAETVHTVPLGADPERFPLERREELREGFDIHPDATVVLFVGEYSAAKGIGELLEAIDGLERGGRERGETLEFVFVGHSGSMREDVERTLARNGYPTAHVYWRLSPEAVAEWFAVADLLVLPSHAEGRPTVVYEAMASETAVLASTVGGIPEQVVDGETGRLVPPRDATALRESLEALVRDPGTLREMGRRGRARLEGEGWTWAGHAARVRTLHEGVL